VELYQDSRFAIDQLVIIATILCRVFTTILLCITSKIFVPVIAMTAGL
jgi:hypothetical protein